MTFNQLDEDDDPEPQPINAAVRMATGKTAAYHHGFRVRQLKGPASTRTAIGKSRVLLSDVNVAPLSIEPIAFLTRKARRPLVPLITSLSQADEVV